MRRVWTVGLLVAVIAGLVLVAAAVLAQTGVVDLDLDQRRTGEPGDRFLEAEVAATNEIGWTCGAFLERRNNKSTHPGTHVIIESGANSITFADIESEAFDEAILAFVIDGDIFVYTQIGEDGISSMGYLLEFECNPPTTTSSTTTTPTTSPVTTTTEPPPINGIDTGGGACADGACDRSFSSVPTWTWIVIGLFLAIGLVWAFVMARFMGRR